MIAIFSTSIKVIQLLLLVPHESNIKYMEYFFLVCDFIKAGVLLDETHSFFPQFSYVGVSISLKSILKTKYSVQIKLAQLDFGDFPKMGLILR